MVKGKIGKLDFFYAKQTIFLFFKGFFENAGQIIKAFSIFCNKKNSMAKKLVHNFSIGSGCPIVLFYKENGICAAITALYFSQLPLLVFFLLVFQFQTLDLK